MNSTRNFEEAVAAFAHGGRYDNYLSIVRKGLIAYGDNAETVFDYVMQNAPGPKPNPAKVRSAIRHALAHPLDKCQTPRPARGRIIKTKAELRELHRKSLTASDRGFVPALRELGRTAVCDGIPELLVTDLYASLVRNCNHFSERDYRLQAAWQLRAAFRPGEKIWAGDIARGTDGATRKTPFLGDGIIEAHDLAERLAAVEGMRIPTHVSLNPLTGKAGRTASGRRSFDCMETVAAYRHALVEFDRLYDVDAQGAKTPSEAHLAVVAGIFRRAREVGDAIPLCAVYTGGKSIHIPMFVKAADLGEYKRQCAALAALFASADDETFRADADNWESGANAITHLRLAGAFRPETNRRACLLWSGTPPWKDSPK